VDLSGAILQRYKNNYAIVPKSQAIKTCIFCERLGIKSIQHAILNEGERTHNLIYREET